MPVGVAKQKGRDAAAEVSSNLGRDLCSKTPRRFGLLYIDCWLGTVAVSCWVLLYRVPSISPGGGGGLREQD